MARRPAKKRKSVISRKSRRGKSKRARSGKRKSSSALWQRIKSWRWRYILLTLFAILLAYVIYLDVVVRSQFEGKRWALPAKVYARPMEMYVGLPLSQPQFIQELELLGYRYSYEASDPGSYARQGNTLSIVTRPFAFWDGHEPSRQVDIVFADGVVYNLKDSLTREEINLLRLQPPLIGGIYPAHNEDRILIKLADVPLLLSKTLLAVEDRKFYEHHGINLSAIGRAMLANIRAGRMVQGGSTLTQQLVKNFFLSNERSLWRKANEAVMSLLLELHYSKDEILQAYMNEIYLGQDNKRGIHGFGLASRFYFDKPLHRLNLSQVATLIALVRGPSYYDPQRHPKRLLKRRNLVLAIMTEQKLITSATANKVKQASLGVIRGKRSNSEYPAFMDLVRRQLQRDYRKEDLSSEGLQIFTTLDPYIQARVEKSLSSRIKELDRKRNLHGKLQGAVVVTSTTGGEVLALASDRKPRYAGFNRALDALRPVGSLIKPAVYLTAIRQPEKFTLASVIDDKPISLKGQNGVVWTPKNYDGKSHGAVPLFKALSHSYNQATVRLGMKLGFEPILDTLRKLGVEREIPPYPSMLLGASSHSPYEVTKMYHTLASGGFHSPLRAIREVMTVDGEPLRRFPINVEQTLDAASVEILNSALQEVTRNGTARYLQSRIPQGIQVAGKTGTTNDQRDSWFAGFSASHLAVVWLGLDDNQPTGLTGSSGALRVWADVFAEMPTRSLQTLPSNEVAYHWIDSESGLLSDKRCSGAVYLAFIKDSAPRESVSCAMNKRNSDEGGGAVDWFKGLFD